MLIKSILAVFSLFFLTSFLAKVNSPSGLNQSDWQSIQSQIAKSQYQPQPNTDGSYHTINHQHGFNIHYGQDGKTTLQSIINNYHIDTKLTNIGNQSMPEQPEALQSEDNKLRYHWNSNVEELWINNEQKLEQWFTIQTKPTKANPSEDLILAMAIESNLTITQQGNQLVFSGEGNHITYDQLKVWDANQTIIPANMQLDNNLLTLHIQDQHAVYPLTIDPSFEQQAYLKTNNVDQGDNFGSSIALDGNTLVIGARYEDGDGNDELNNDEMNSGAVYVFTRDDNNNWIQQTYLKASNTGPGDQFGSSIALDGNTLAIGAKEEDGDGSDEANNDKKDSGAAYVFIRDENDNWIQQAYLKASNVDKDDLFGRSIALDDDTLAVGAIWEDANGNNNKNSGAVYVFTRDENDIWSQQACLKADNAGEWHLFGYSVALEDNTLAIGASGEDGDDKTNSGAVYIFIRDEDNDNWNQQAYLKASNVGEYDFFGISVALENDTLTIGAQGESGDGNDQANNDKPNSGAAYVFTRDNDNNWNQQAYLKASNVGSGSVFGSSIALNGNILAIGADGEDGDKVGSGAAYVFTRDDNNNWSQQAYLKASNVDTSDFFGFSIALDGNILAIGAVHEAGDGSDEINNDKTNSGAAYVFYRTDIFSDGFED